MSFVSYAQNYEDVMLWRALKHIENGFYIDVGANDPDVDSVTKAFYERGWRGINIEPINQWFEKLNETRTRDINLKVAAGAKEGKRRIYEFPDTGLSTMDKATAERHEAERGYKKIERRVPVKTLTEICLAYHVSPIHFLNIDVEGVEKMVLQGLDLKQIRPWIIVVESTLPNTEIENHETWEPIILGADYEYVYFDGLNRFYLAREYAGLKNSLKKPPNVFDSFISRQQFVSERRAKTAEGQLKDIQEQLTELQTQAQLLQNDRDTINQMMESFRRQAGELETALTNEREDKSKVENELASARQQLEQTQAQTQLLHSEWNTAKQKLESLSHQVGALETALTIEREDKSKVENELASTRKQLEQMDAHAKWLQNEWDAAKVKINELNHSSHHWWLDADRLNKELQAVYGSKSWRITWPLRKLMKFFRWLFALPIRITLWLIRLPKRSVRWLLLKAMAYSLKRPGLKAWAMARLRKYPNLEAKLRRLAQARGLVAVQSGKPSMPVQPATESVESPIPAQAEPKSPINVDEIMARIREEVANRKRDLVDRDKPTHEQVNKNKDFFLGY